MGPIYYHGRYILLRVERIARNSAEIYSTLCDPLWPAAVPELQSKGWEGNDRNSVLPKLQRKKIMLPNMRGNDRNSEANRTLYFSVYTCSCLFATELHQVYMSKDRNNQNMK